MPSAVKPPIIFLDVDGVLNSHAFFTTEYERRGGPVSGMREEQLDPDAIKVLNQIVARTGSKIVVSSTWRMAPRFFTDVLPMFRERGLEGEVIGRTPRLPHPNVRGDEILCYMSTMTYWPQFAILDDDSDMGELMPWLVQTDTALGLCPNHVDCVVETLNKPGWR